MSGDNKHICQRDLFILYIYRFSVYMHDCGDETPDCDENQALLEDYNQIQAYA